MPHILINSLVLLNQMKLGLELPSEYSAVMVYGELFEVVRAQPHSGQVKRVCHLFPLQLPVSDLVKDGPVDVALAHLSNIVNANVKLVSFQKGSPQVKALFF